MSSATRCTIKLNENRDPKLELEIALTKLKKKVREDNIFFEHIDRLHFKRPAVRRKEKSKRALQRRWLEEKRERKRKSAS